LESSLANMLNPRLRLSLLLSVMLGGCSPVQENGPAQKVGSPGKTDNPSCADSKDSDGDGISDANEGAAQKPPRDTDGDGKPDYLDSDSDNDGIPDAVEAGNQHDVCVAPVDSDGDGKPDYIDLDSDDPHDGSIPDAVEAGMDPTHPVDTDGNGRPDYLDADNDGDGILDLVELTPQGASVPATTLAAAPDTDGDGIPDFMDTDSDGDTIADHDEGAIDTDGDGLPNYRDLDSDGDCIPDAAEAGDSDPTTPPVDSDADGFPDYVDLDSDNEGLIDQLEDANCNGVVDPCETDRTKADSDGDGVNDLIEYEDCHVKSAAEQAALMCQCDGSDGSKSPLTRGDFVFVVDYMASPAPQSETLNLATNVSQADVVFALDSTGSMQGSLDTLANTIASTIIPQVQAKVKNIAFGVVDFKDFTSDSSYVMEYDYRITTASTTAGVMAVQSSLQALATAGASGGGDSPEAGWEALYSIAGGPAMSATGAGRSWSSTMSLGSTKPLTPPAGETQGNVGGAGFRAGSVPIIVTATDAEWHDAPGTAASGEDGLNDYPSSQFSAGSVPTRATALKQLGLLNAHVMGMAGTGGYSSGNAKARALATATATGAVVNVADFGPVGVRPANCGIKQCCTGQGGAGENDTPLNSGNCPLSFTYDDGTGNGISGAVVSGIIALANGLKFDIHVEASDVDAGTVDNFVDRVVPNVSGAGAASICIVVPSGSLHDNFTGPEATPGADGVPDTLTAVSGGAEVCFDVVAKMNTNVMPTSQVQFFHAKLQVKGVSNGATVNLGTPRDIFFLVPPQIKNGPIG
jgi:hypothetical protein